MSFQDRCKHPGACRAWTGVGTGAGLGGRVLQAVNCAMPLCAEKCRVVIIAVLCCAVLCCVDDDLRVILSKLPDGVKFTFVAGGNLHCIKLT